MVGHMCASFAKQRKANCSTRIISTRSKLAHKLTANMDDEDDATSLIHAEGLQLELRKRNKRENPNQYEATTAHAYVQAPYRQNPHQIDDFVQVALGQLEQLHEYISFSVTEYGGV
ncbi:hypothetical protein L7F22_060799 [Adiantum nelumboides]|nr:hypothetical protein [Adiantum nelumboides]